MKGKPKSKRGKDRRYQHRDNRHEDRRPQDFGSSPRGPRSAENDVSWYSKYPNLLIAAGSFPYPYRPGMSLPMGSRTLTFADKTVTGSVSSVVPGVMALEWVPSLGVSNTATDPASVMAKEIYAKVRSAFSGSINADAPDFVMYLLSLDGIFSYIAGLKRIYRVLTAWSPDNYALPDTVLQALGLSSTEIPLIRADKMKLWQAINTLVLQSRKFTCPAVMDYFNRHYWMNDNVYADAPSINSQFYLFQMNGVYKFAELAMPNGDLAGGLQMVYTPWNRSMRQTQNQITVDKLLQFGLDLIDALVAWDEAYEINGYLNKAFEGTPQFIVDELPIEQPFNPVYSEEVLAQIENSRCAPATDGMSYLGANNYQGFNITQNVLTNAVISNPQYTVPNDACWELVGQGYKLPPILSSRSDAPTVANNVISSRLQCAVLGYDSTSKVVKLQCASEIPLGWYMWIPGSSGVYVAQVPVVASYHNLVSGKMEHSDNGVANRITYTLDVGQFDWHPFIFVVSASTAANAGVVSSTTWSAKVAGDVHNVTVISDSDLQNLHRICLYSELNSFSVN